MHSPDLTQSNLDKIAELFPQVMTEATDDEGNVVRAVNFDLLRQELSDHVVEGPQERYQLDWPGKRAALFAANAPIAKTLRPMREESVDFDTTKNLFIEGDNLDALKLLQESYLGKVKLIYIDPPYNTGNDFVYPDDFAESSHEYLLKSGQESSDGTRLISNPDSSGRFHSDWLTMMYPRLRLARNLLADDGALVVSIDDGEVGSLRLLLNEVFGARNFVGSFIWKSRQIVDSRNATNMSGDHEYVIVYARNSLEFALVGQDIDLQKYSNPDADARGPWMSNNILGLADATRRPNLHYAITDPATGNVYEPPSDSGWRYGKETMAGKIAEGRILFPAKAGGRPREKLYLQDLRSRKTGTSSVLSSDVGYTLNGTREVRQLLGGKYFDFPKPVSLLSFIISQIADTPEDIVLDFFAGSGSTAHAVLAQNSVDGGDRRYVLVQVAEAVPESSVASKAGYSTIPQIARIRIDRASEVLKDDGPTAIDFGYRYLRVDTSTSNDVLRTPDETGQADLGLLEGSVKADRTSEDLLFQVLLDWGLELSLPIEQVEVAGQDAVVVDDGALVACFESSVTAETVRAIADLKPLRAVFRDSAFDSDKDRINAEQIFAEVSPDTDVKVI